MCGHVTREYDAQSDLDDNECLQSNKRNSNTTSIQEIRIYTTEFIERYAGKFCERLSFASKQEHVVWDSRLSGVDKVGDALMNKVGRIISEILLYVINLDEGILEKYWDFIPKIILRHKKLMTQHRAYLPENMPMPPLQATSVTQT